MPRSPQLAASSTLPFRPFSGHRSDPPQRRTLYGAHHSLLTQHAHPEAAQKHAGRLAGLPPEGIRCSRDLAAIHGGERNRCESDRNQIGRFLSGKRLSSEATAGK